MTTDDVWQETLEWYFREIEPQLRRTLAHELERALDDALLHGQGPKMHPAFCRAATLRGRIGRPALETETA